ncbi:MAG: thiosulfate sulfurtransferase GlpE [Nitrospinaceae bacterium]
MTAFQELGVEQVQEMLNGREVNIVDIRDPASYTSGHLPSAVSLSDDTVKDYIENSDKERPLIVYCYHGISSQGAAAYFSQQGFKEVYSMRGGFAAWPIAYPRE